LRDLHPPKGRSRPCKERDKNRPQMSRADRQSGNGFIDAATLRELVENARREARAYA
jgi:hypothetical protein